MSRNASEALSTSPSAPTLYVFPLLCDEAVWRAPDPLYGRRLMIQFDAAPVVPPHRARRMLAALIGGFSPDAIGAEEDLPVKTVEQALRDELSRRWMAPVADFAKIQIARLESLCLQLMDRVEAGELPAVDRALKIIDRLDRYHGFHRASPALEQYGDEHRARLLAKLNAAAASLADAESESQSNA
jgi:hypothetical protein